MTRFAMVLMTLMLAGCGGWYERIVTEPDGSKTTYAIYHERSWWANMGEPDWMAVRTEQVLKGGKIVQETRCTHEQPELLVCRIVK